MTPRKVVLVQPWASGGTAEYAKRLIGALPSGDGFKWNLLIPGGAACVRNQSLGVRGIPAIVGSRFGHPLMNGVAVPLARRRQRSGVRTAVASMNDCDVIHCMSATAASPGLLRLAKSSGRGMVVTLHDLPVGEYGRGGDAILARAKRRLAIGRSAFQFAHVVVVHGAVMAERLRRHENVAGESIVTVPQPLYSYGPAACRDDYRQSLGIGTDEVVWLAFGGLRPSKGLPDALKMVDSLPADYRLVIAGEQQSRSTQESSLLESAIEGRLRRKAMWIRSRVPDSDIRRLFSAVDGVVLPYTGDFAGYSAVLKVAMNYGRPVVASRNPFLREEVDRYGVGVVVDTATPEEFADAVIRVSGEDPSQYSLGQTWKASLSWEAAAEGYGSAYALADQSRLGK